MVDFWASLEMNWFSSFLSVSLSLDGSSCVEGSIVVVLGFEGSKHGGMYYMLTDVMVWRIKVERMDCCRIP